MRLFKGWFNKIFGIPDYEKIYKETSSKHNGDASYNEEFQQNQQNESVNLQEPEIVGVVNFVLDADGNIKIVMNWINQLEHAESFGKMLWMIHASHTKVTNIGKLSDMAKEHPSLKRFIKKVARTWSKLDNNDSPLVRPGMALKPPSVRNEE